MSAWGWAALTGSAVAAAVILAAAVLVIRGFARAWPVIRRGARAAWEAYRNFPVPADGEPLDDDEEDGLAEARAALADQDGTEAVAAMERNAEARMREAGK